MYRAHPIPSSLFPLLTCIYLLTTAYSSDTEIILDGEVWCDHRDGAGVVTGTVMRDYIIGTVLS